MPRRFQIGDRVYIKNDKKIYTLTEYVSDDGYAAQYTGYYKDKSIVMTVTWLPDALIEGRG